MKANRNIIHSLVVEINETQKQNKMKNLELKLESLINKYYELRDTDEIMNSEYFDSISYDIEGYNESIYEALDDEDIDELRHIESNLVKQVATINKLVIAMKNIEFIYA